MKKTAKIILSFVVMTILSVASAVGVFAADAPNIVYTSGTKTVTATATVSADGEYKVLVVCSYKNGLLMEIKTDKKYITGTETLSATVKKGVDEVIANVVDAFGGGTASSAAVYAADTVEVRGITVNGENIEGFSDEVNEYTIKCKEGTVDINVIAKDATTKVTVSDNISPGTANIELVSSRGRKRNIVINMYSQEEQTYKLSGLTYKIGDTEYEIPGFNPDEKMYTVNLPDNTMSVRLYPKTVGNAHVYVSNDFVGELNGISLGTIVDVASSAYPFKRNAAHNLIPVKSGVATAEIVVTNTEDTEESVYTINFTAKQPELTEFNLTGCADDPIQPTFVGGSAVNNDNGTMTAKDRGWAVGNVSKSLLGGSCFMFPIQNSKTADQWWYNNTKGEYFNFTADTAGTIVVLSANTITNKSEYEEAGWVDVSGTTPSVPDDTIDGYRGIAKDWNDYENEYFMSNIQYNTAYATTKRAQNPGIAATDQFGELTSQGMSYGYKRTFEAGENVSIYHTGRKDGNAVAMMAVIVWDGVNYAPDAETSTGSGETEELLPELPSLDIVNPDAVLEVSFTKDTDTSSNIWKDDSGKNNDITLINDGDIGMWTENGYLLKAGKGKIALPQQVTDTLNTNVCSIQFELADFTIDENVSSVGIMSVEENMFVYASETDARLLWATTALKRPRVPYDKIMAGKHTITIDKNEKKIKWYVGSELVDTRDMNSTDKATAALYIGTDDENYSGEIVIKSLAVYNKALTQAEISGGDAE